MDFAEELRQYRVLKKYSQGKMAKVLGIKGSAPQQVYSKLESGITKKISPEILNKFNELKRDVGEVANVISEPEQVLQRSKSPLKVASKNIDGDISQQILLNLSDSNRELVDVAKTTADAVKNLSDAHLILTKNYDKSIAENHQEKSIIFDAKFSDLLELIAAVGSGEKKWLSKNEAVAELSKQFYGIAANG